MDIYFPPDDELFSFLLSDFWPNFMGGLVYLHDAPKLNNVSDPPGP
jgi:hypothetical protein